MSPPWLATSESLPAARERVADGLTVTVAVCGIFSSARTASARPVSPTRQWQTQQFCVHSVTVPRDCLWRDPQAIKMVLGASMHGYHRAGLYSSWSWPSWNRPSTGWRALQSTVRYRIFKNGKVLSGSWPRLPQRYSAGVLFGTYSRQTWTMVHIPLMPARALTYADGFSHRQAIYGHDGLCY